MNLMTTGEMAKKLNVDRDKVSYALRRMGIAPIGIAGHTRVFDESAVVFVEKFLNHNQFVKKTSNYIVVCLSKLNLFITFSTVEKVRIYNLSKFTERNKIMLTFSLQLISFPGNRGDKNKLLYGPRVYICVGSRSKIKCPSKKGNIERDALSNECVTSRELEEEADRLIEELQQIKRQAKKFFEKELPNKFC